ncbi:MAG: hypothetical protein SFU91_14030 [Chloroherpetonaceae bacterium]|nr:hypothetical protein [Chloroherpetonaceae bacterium]
MNKFFLVGFISLILFSACGSKEIQKPIEKKVSDSTDIRLVGVWEGMETDYQKLGMQKHWMQQRFADGTYVIMFVAIENGSGKRSVEYGKWWVKDGIFYEQCSSCKKSDSYQYSFLSDSNETLKYKLITSQEKFADENYEFLEFKVNLK